MNIKTALSILFSFLMSVFAVAESGIKYKVRHITTNDGLPSNTIRDIEQDRYGYIWVGGTNGLSRFDGYRFVSFNMFGKYGASNIPQHIGLMNIDERGDLLWICTSTYSYGCYDISGGRFLPLTREDGTERQYSRRFYSSDGLWMYNNNGICRTRYVDGNIEFTDFTKENGSLPSNKVRNIVEDGTGQRWIATDKGLAVISVDNHAKTLLRGKNIINCLLSGDKVAAYCRSDQSCYIFGIDGKLVRRYRLPASMGKIVRLTSAIEWRGKLVYFTPGDTYMLDLKTGRFSKPEYCQIPRGYQQGDIDGYRFVANRSGSMWVFPPRGEVKKLTLNENLSTTNEKNKLYSFARGKDGVFYIASYGMGLFVYNSRTGELACHTADDKSPLIYSNYLLDVEVDKDGCIWISAEAAGITCIRPINELATVHYYHVDPSRTGDWTNYIRYFYRGKDGGYYASTKDNGLYSFDVAERKFTFERKMKANIYNYMVDSKGREWVSTRGDGLYVDGVRYSREDKRHRIHSNDFFNTLEDRLGRVWIATWDAGLLMAELEDGKAMRFKQYLNGDVNKRKIHDLEEGPNGELFVATHNGLYVVDATKRNITENDFICYNLENGKMPNDETHCLKYAYGYLWAGVMASGVVRCDFSKGLSNMSYKVIGQKEGLPDNDVNTISQDRYGYLWIGCGSGLARLNPKNSNIYKYDFGGSPHENSFTENGSRELADGRIAFGTRGGLLIISPNGNIRKHMDGGKVFLTDLQVNGNSVYEEANGALLDSALAVTRRIRLPHNQNSITICYSDFNYGDINSQLYQVRLEGLDDGWSKATAENRVEYDNLSPGTYRFMVRAFDGDKWGEATELAIVIAQPWYNTWWAWLVYIAACAAAAVYVYGNAKKRLRLSQQIKLEKQITEFRIKFFTHIAHEFRTPLAIIQNGVNQLQDPSTGHVSKTALQSAKRGVKRLMKLINQFMEFRKVGTGNMNLQVEQDDVIKFVRDIWQDLWNMAKQKDVNYVFRPFDKQYVMMFDKHIVETIVYNLLSNALKYTPGKGSVTFSVAHDVENGKIVFAVEDNGSGIPVGLQKELFKPFMHGYASMGGMGIGLYTAYNMAAVHHGILAYETGQDSRGSLFTFTMPDASHEYEDSEILKSVAVETSDGDVSRLEDIIHSIAPESLNNQVIAIIEDDADMMKQLSEAIGVYFRTLRYYNGKEGYEGVMKEKPDLVVCDVMLPDMDGYEIIRRVKSDIAMAYTPVIMLTALDDEEHQIKGYQAGADDYMVKPCNFRLLLARIIQLIKWKESHSQSNLSDEATPDVKADNTAEGLVFENKADKTFKENVRNLVIAHMGEPDFNVDVLAQMMHMGRSKFYGKMKEIYGMSPNKFIINERMEAAARLLIEGKLNIAEISIKVGIMDPSHFNKSFKAKYGVPPSKYKG